MTTLSATAATWKANPFLHVEDGRIYDPTTDRSLSAIDSGFRELLDIVNGNASAEALDDGMRVLLARGGWIVSSAVDLSTRSHLKLVSLETNTVCNQACYFCPVSIDPREEAQMSDAMFSSILDQLGAYRGSLDAVFLQSYNEPTIDRRFVEHCSAIMKAGLPVAVLSNGSGLTPKKIDALVEAGPLRYLCINLSTLDQQRYEQDRGFDHLQVVLRNLDHAKDRELAREMKIVVLGKGDDSHVRDFETIRERFAGSRFTVEPHTVMDRAGYLNVGIARETPLKKLRGCDNLGSRPIQHLHITPKGKCVLCCEDYDEDYVVGDLTSHTIGEVLAGPAMAKLRRWTYGLEEAPDDFICRKCIFAKGE